LSRESQNIAGAEALGIVEGNMCGVVMRDAVAPPRSKTPSLSVGTWETSPGPQSLRRSRAAAGRRGAEAAVEQARSRTSLVVPMKRSNKAVRSGGGGRGGKGARSEGWRTTGDAPGAEPDKARPCPSPASGSEMRGEARVLRSRPTSGRSPVRESRTPGSVRGTGSNSCPYRDFPVAVGTRIATRPPQSGRTEARTGLRMMPTSPRSPLSFRTAGFPRYGWKAGLSDRAFPRRWSA